MKQKIIFVLISVMVLSLMFPMNVSAASGIDQIDELEGIDTGDGQYIQYSDNYHLDRIDPGLFDKWSNNAVDVISNFFFGVFKEFSYLTIVLFYHCFSFDIAEMFGDELSGIQSALRSVFFDGGVFLIVFATSAFYIIKQLLQGNLQNLLSEVLKVMAILVISMAVATESTTFLHFVNTTAKQISVEALGGISGQTLSSDNDATREANLKTYAADTASILWSGLVHKPWVSLEFGDGYTGNVELNTEKLLLQNKISDKRKEAVKDLHDQDESLFNEAVGWNRIFPAFMMAFPIMIKCVFYLIIAILQMSFQVLTLFYVILCPLILLLAVSPQLGGMELIWSWLKKIVETQISVLILTFVIGLIVKYDAMISSGNFGGWLIGLWLQVALIIILVFNWQKVLMMLSMATSTIENPRLALAMRQMRRQSMHMGMPYAIPGAVHGAQQLAGMVGTAGSAAGSALEYGISGAWDGVSGAWGNFSNGFNTPKTNYNNVQQYKPRTPTPPPPPNSPAPSNSPSASTTQEKVTANGAVNQRKVVDYNKIPRYKNNSQSAAPVQRPISYKVAANGEDLHNTYKTTSEATQKPYTVNYSTRASSYTASNKTPSEAVQRPRTVEYTPSPGRTTTAQTPHTASQKLTSVKADSNIQRPANRNTSILTNARQFVPKPVVKDFEFNSQRSTIKSSPSMSRPASESTDKPKPRPKPVVEQFNFKAHDTSKK